MTYPDVVPLVPGTDNAVFQFRATTDEGLFDDHTLQGRSQQTALRQWKPLNTDMVSLKNFKL